MEQVRYGVFAVGPLWQLVTGDGSTCVFTDRATAIAQAQAAAEAARARGQEVELLVQQLDNTLVSARHSAF